MKLLQKPSPGSASGPEPPQAEGRHALLAFLLAVTFFWLFFSLSGLLHGWSWWSFHLPLEVVVIVAGYALLPMQVSRYLRWPLALLLFSGGMVQFLDQAMRVFLGRPLNLLLDINLLPAGVELMQGAVGPLLSGLLFLALGLVLLLLLLGCARALHNLEAISAPRTALSIFGLVLAAGYLPEAQRASLPISAHLTQSFMGQVDRIVSVVHERPAFEAALARDPFSQAFPEDSFTALGEASVMVVFVESYGKQALEDPRYASRTKPALEKLQQAAEEKELHSLSGWAEAPTIGGQSWLSHASFLSGLWIDNQIKYQLLSESKRRTLAQAFSENGRKSHLVMPAITRAWPEAGFMGFDRHIFAQDMNYAGEAYNWVTMPDQYTLSYFEREIRSEGTPFFAMLSLISSHAPWTPIAPVLEDWQSIGDGAVFSRWADSGESPAELWQNPERVRSHYALSIEYVLESLGSYIRNAPVEEDPLLMVVLGDHEAGAIVSGHDAPHQVPVHIFATDRELLRPFRGANFTKGAIPRASSALFRMHDFRDFFIQNYRAKLAETVRVN